MRPPKAAPDAAPITPHLSPQALHPGNGIERYVSGIGKLAREEGVRHVLPAHFDPIPDLGARVREIAEDHAARLQRVADVCARGAIRTIRMASPARAGSTLLPM